MFPFRKKKPTAAKAMPESQPAAESKSLAESDFSSTAEQEKLFKPYAPDDEFVQFSLDDGVEVLVFSEGSPKLDEGYSDRRVVLTLRDYIRGNTTLDEAKGRMLEFVTAHGSGSFGTCSSFGSCMMHTAEQIPYNTHSLGQARLVQLLREVYHFLSPASLSEFRISTYEYFDPGTDPSYDGRPYPDDPFRLTLNLGAFFARLSQSGLINMFSYGIRTIRQLEHEHTDLRFADTVASLAALWIIFAGQSLYTWVVEAPLVPEPGKENALHSTGPLYNGPVYGRERWAFWRDALKAAAERENASDESKKLARNAAEVMDVIERSVQF
ncbi:hypothetical protein V8F06_008929 [Rhypophila decipiens]